MSEAPGAVDQPRVRTIDLVEDLAGSVDVTSVLDSMDQDDPLVLDDLLDNPVVAPPGRVENLEFAEKRFPKSMRISSDRSENCCGRPRSCINSSSRVMSNLALLAGSPAAVLRPKIPTTRAIHGVVGSACGAL